MDLTTQVYRITLKDDENVLKWGGWWWLHNSVCRLKKLLHAKKEAVLYVLLWKTCHWWIQRYRTLVYGTWHPFYRHKRAPAVNRLFLVAAAAHWQWRLPPREGAQWPMAREQRPLSKYSLNSFHTFSAAYHTHAYRNELLIYKDKKEKRGCWESGKVVPISDPNTTPPLPNPCCLRRIY